MSPLFRGLLLIGAATGGLIVMARVANTRSQRAHKRAHKDELLDEALDGTFPASDPPATQDFADPANR